MTLEELQALVESNARTIQGMLEAIAEERKERADIQSAATQYERHELRQATSRIERLTLLKKLDAIENKVDRLLGRQ